MREQIIPIGFVQKKQRNILENIHIHTPILNHTTEKNTLLCKALSTQAENQFQTTKMSFNFFFSYLNYIFCNHNVITSQIYYICLQLYMHINEFIEVVLL